MLRSVQRFPWWIIVFESLQQAPDIDRRGVRKILEEGEVVFESDRDAYHARFDRCVLVFDTLDCLEREPPWGIETLS